MSVRLYIQPVITSNKSFTHPLKGIIARRYFDQDGSLSSSKRVLERKDIPFLEGLVAADVEDADELLSELNEHGSLFIWIGE
jgi:hypothetical protein